ncbi:MAG: hypothetical protein ACERKD_16100 [Prolixibacteraceae bacterium]
MSSQFKLAGEIPFYALPTFYDTRQNQDGLGGMFTMRGISRNRIVANSYLSANVEFRKRIAVFSLLKLNWEIDISLFTDAAYIAGTYKFSTRDIPVEILRQNFSNAVQMPFYSYGIGGYLIYNTNNIISINYGISPNKQLGNNGLYVGSAFLF